MAMLFTSSKSSIFFTHPERQVYKGLRLIFCWVFLGIGVQYGSFWFTRCRQRHCVNRVVGRSPLIPAGSSVEYVRYDRILAFVYGAWSALAAHTAIDRLNGRFTGIGRSKSFHKDISPFLDWRVVTVQCRAC